MTLTRRQVRDLLVEHGASPRQARGQNFVVDPNTVRRVARLAGVGPGSRVVEVGAGLGSLTLALAETGASVVAVEVDTRLVGALRSVVATAAAVTVVEGDAMRLDWVGLLRGGGWTLVANLPYNIATPLVADLLDGVPAIERMVVMVQSEVASRLAAGVGDDAYGAVSVKVRYWADAAVVGQVPPTVFYPQPKVDSAIVDIRRHARQPAGVARERLFALVAAGFGQRRKMLRRSLAGMVGADCFVAAEVRPDARAEELDVGAWARLAACAPSLPPPS